MGEDDVVGGGEAVIAMVDADTITDEQIRELRKARLISGVTFSLAVIGRGRGPDREARTHCAEILNARDEQP